MFENLVVLGEQDNQSEKKKLQSPSGQDNHSVGIFIEVPKAILNTPNEKFPPGLGKHSVGIFIEVAQTILKIPNEESPLGLGKHSENTISIVELMPCQPPAIRTWIDPILHLTSKEGKVRHLVT